MWYCNHSICKLTKYPGICAGHLLGIAVNKQNLKLEEIKNPPDLAHARIYDCILERCAPVLFSGKNFREEGAMATKAAAKEIVRVHFSKTSRETMSDKIKRMLKNEIQQM